MFSITQNQAKIKAKTNNQPTVKATAKTFLQRPLLTKICCCVLKPKGHQTIVKIKCVKCGMVGTVWIGCRSMDKKEQ